MNFEFADSELIKLYTEEKGDYARLDKAVRDRFFLAMDRISAIIDFDELREWRGGRLEELKGNRQGEYSVRLGDQYRLIFTREESEEGPFLKILKIEDYH